MEESKRLRDEGFEIIKDLELLKLLERYGEARLVGSLALDLVVKPDIDFHLYLDQTNLIEVVGSLLVSLISDTRIREVRVTDHLERDSLKIGIDHLAGRSTDWSVDIWVTSDRSTTGFEELDQYQEMLNQETRKIILEIKHHYFEKGLLRDGLSSKIYRAVLKEGVSNLGEFKYDYEKDSRGP